MSGAPGAPRRGARTDALRFFISGWMASRNKRASETRLSPIGAFEDMFGSSVICRSWVPFGTYSPPT